MRFQQMEASESENPSPAAYLGITPWLSKDVLLELVDLRLLCSHEQRGRRLQTVTHPVSFTCAYCGCQNEITPLKKLLLHVKTCNTAEPSNDRLLGLAISYYDVLYGCTVFLFFTCLAIYRALIVSTTRPTYLILPFTFPIP